MLQRQTPPSPYSMHMQPQQGPFSNEMQSMMRNRSNSIQMMPPSHVQMTPVGRANSMQMMPGPNNMQMMPGGMPGNMVMGPEKKQGGLLSRLFKGKNRSADNIYPMINASPYTGMNTYYAPTPQPFPNQQQVSPEQFRKMTPQAAATSATMNAARTADNGQTSGGIGSFFSKVLADPSIMVNNVEKFVQAAQTVGPVVQQYGPLIQKVPGITKIFSSLKASSDTSKQKTEAKTEAAKTTTKPTPPVKKNEETDLLQTPKANPSSTSAPKLYV